VTSGDRFRRRYGAGPLHLLGLIASFAIAGAAVIGWFQRPRDVKTVLEWFFAAIVLHDLVAVPIYSLLDRIAFAGVRRRARRESDAGTVAAGPHRVRASRRPARSGVNPAPYLRVPALLSGLLLVVFFPVVFGLGAQSELSASGIPERGYLARWLLAGGVMFALSGGAYAVAAGRARHDRPAPTPPHPPTAASPPAAGSDP
jgi:hypothetical protein